MARLSELLERAARRGRAAGVVAGFTLAELGATSCPSELLRCLINPEYSGSVRVRVEARRVGDACGCECFCRGNSSPYEFNCGSRLIRVEYNGSCIELIITEA